jgi:predicted lysophospholipase L1 biosynthesis ABC-type transport system permease subunit
LNESAMRQYFGRVDALGSHFSIFDPKQKIRIIGVAADTKLNSLRDVAPPIVYLPFFQSEFRGTSGMPATLELRLTGGSEVAESALQQVIRTTAPGLTARRVRTQNALVEDSLMREKLMSVISSSLGFLATLLAAFGLAGAVAQAVSNRTQELGIRIALGADNRDLIFSSVKRAMAPVAAGIAIGIPLSLGVARVLRSALFGAEPFDPLVLSGGILLLVALTAVAAYVPSMRTTRIDPLAAIRHD